MLTGVIPKRAIMVHDLTQARAATGVATEMDLPVTLTTAHGAAAYLGPGWATALLAALADEFPQADIALVFDCGDKPGHVLAALRVGLKAIRFTGRKAAAVKLAEIAAAQGAQILTGRLRTLDLGQEAAPEAACRRWLSGS